MTATDMDHADDVKAESTGEAGDPDLQVATDASLFADIFLRSPIGIYIVQDRKFRFVNPEFQEITEFTERELLGKESLGIVQPEDRETVREKAVSMLRGELDSPYLYRCVTKGGETKWIIETVTSIMYAGRRATLGNFMDNTKEVLAVQALRLSEEKFSKAFRSSPDWIVISVLEDGFYVDVNDAFLRATGYRREEVIGHTSVELGIWADPKDRIELVKQLRREGKVRNLECRFRMKSGEVRFMLWAAEVIDFEGEKCLIAVARDITDRKRREQERLEQRRLEGALELAGAACHELNQPMQYAIYLLDEALKERPDSRPLGDLKAQLDRIRAITGKLQNITIYRTKDYVGGAKIIDIDESSRPS